MTDPHDLQSRYDAIWDEAAPALARGDVSCDAQLAAGNDPRRGLTLIARPDAQLAASFSALLDRLTDIEPEQYRHPVPDMHVTVLSLFTATVDHEPELARAEAYRAAVAAAVRGTPSFTIDFTGVTASRGAVLAQGFPQGDALPALRDRLRHELRARGLASSLDSRYKLITAHATLLRFVRPLTACKPFLHALTQLRDTPLGTMHVNALELVQNDWYMSSATLEWHARYDLV